jgi:hypothetical protein
MTEKAKARELINSYTKILLNAKYRVSGLVIGSIVKECASMFADQMIEETKAKYWYDVRHNIENYKID